MRPIACLSASFIGRLPGYPMTRAQWPRYQQANEAYYRAEDTFAERFDLLVADIQDIGFNAIDLWFGHLNPVWASANMIDVVRSVLARRSMRLASLFGNIGADLPSVEASCRLAQALGCPLLTGDCAVLAPQFSKVADLIGNAGLQLALINRAEKTALEMRRKIAGGLRGVVGIAADTGAFAAFDYAPERAISELADVLLYVFLKDVKARGLLQQACRFGQGIVNLPQCMSALHHAGYQGGLSVAEPSLMAGPQADLKASLEMVRAWVKV